MAFYEEAMRLLREKFTSVDVLATEVWSTFQSWGKGLKGPLKIDSESSDTPLQIRQKPGRPEPPFIMEFFLPDGSKTQMAKDGTMTNTPASGTATNPNVSTTTVATSTTPTGGLLGVIVSGTGSTYSVSVQGAGITVTATHPQISEDEQIPAGRYVSLFQVGETYYILEPTWI